MAAYEVRDIMPRRTVFSKNICRGAGTALPCRGKLCRGVPKSGRSRWDTICLSGGSDQATPGGEIRVENNHFGEAPNGSVVYSIVAPEAEDQFVFSGNRVEPVTDRSFYWKGVYRRASEFESGSWQTE